MKSAHRALTTEDNRCLMCGRTWASTTERGLCNKRAKKRRALSQCNHLLFGQQTPNTAWTEQAPSGLVLISLHLVETKRSWIAEGVSPMSQASSFSCMLVAGSADTRALRMDTWLCMVTYSIVSRARKVTRPVSFHCGTGLSHHIQTSTRIVSF